MAKPLRDITKHGVNASKEVPNDLTNLAMSPEGNKGEIEFAKKHKISRKEDPAGNGDEVFKGSNIKVAKYDKQDAKVYEEAEEELDEKYLGFKKLKASIAAKGDVRDPGAVAAAIGRKKYGKEKFQAAAAKGKKLREATSKCNHTGLGVMCEMHGTEKCPPGIEPKDIPKFGQKVLLDKKATVKEEVISEVAPPNPKIEAWVKANKERFVKEYGKEKGTQVLYAKAWKMHGQSESGSATNTDYTGPGASGWTTGRLDVGTL
jgi:hypothetical protein